MATPGTTAQCKDHLTSEWREDYLNHRVGRGNDSELSGSLFTYPLLCTSALQRVKVVLT